MGLRASSQETPPVRTTPPIRIPKLKTQEETESFRGFFRNLGQDFGSMAKGMTDLALFLPKTLVRGGVEWYKYFRGDEESSAPNAFSAEGLNVIKEGVKDNVGHLIRGLSESYSEYKHPLEKAYNHPLDVIIDLMTIASLGGSAAAVVGARLGTASRFGNAVSRIGLGLQRFGMINLRPMAESPVLKGIRKIPAVDKMLRRVGLTPELVDVDRRFMASTKARRVGTQDDLVNILKASGQVPEKLAQRGLLQAMSGLRTLESIDEAGRRALAIAKKYSDLYTAGTVEFEGITAQQAERAARIPARQAVARVFIRRMEQNKLIGKSERKLLKILLKTTDIRVDNKKLRAFIVGTASKNPRLSWLTDTLLPKTEPFRAVLDKLIPDNILESAINSVFGPGTRQFSYFPLIHEKYLVKSGGGGIPKPLQAYTAGFERVRTGVKGFIRDARVVLPFMTLEKRRWLSLKQLIRELTSQPYFKNVTQNVISRQYKPTPNTKIVSFDASLIPNYIDYIGILDRFGDEIKRAGKIAGNEALNEFLDRTLLVNIEHFNENLAKRLAQKTIYEVPEEVADYLAKKMNQQNPLWKIVFDAPIDILRITALYLNPMWYLGNAFGNLLFLTAAGVSPFSYLRGSFSRFKKIVGDQAIGAISQKLNTAFSQAELQARGISALPPFKTLAQLNERVEDYFRRVAFIDSVSKDAVRNGLISGSEAAFLADEAFGRRIKPLIDAGLERGQNVPSLVLGIKEHSDLSEGINFTNKWLFNYTGLHPMERYVIRRIVPFWTFLKNINLMILRLPLDRPFLSRLAIEINRTELAKTVMDAIGDDSLPYWLENHIPIGTGEKGEFFFLSLRGLNPFAGFGKVDIKQLLAASNPVLKATYEFVSGRDAWSQQNLRNDEPMVDYAGRTYRIKMIGDKAVFQRDTPGPTSFLGVEDPLNFSGLLNQFWRSFPHSRVLMSLVDQQSTDDQGTPVRTPFMDEAGNTVYPQPVHLALLRLFLSVNVKAIDPKKLKVSQLAARGRFIRNIRKTIRFAPKELREFLIDVAGKVAKGKMEIDAY